MSHQVVLLSPYVYPGSYPLTLADEDMAAWLNGYTAMWHPALLWKASEPPRVETPYDHEKPKPATIYVVPETPPNYLPEDWSERLRQVGSLAIAANADRAITLDNLRAALEAVDAPALGWKEALIAPPDMLAMFFGVGLGYLLQGTLAEAMEHENLLEKVAFWELIQKSIEAMGSEEPASPNPDEGSACPPSPRRGEGSRGFDPAGRRFVDSAFARRGSENPLRSGSSLPRLYPLARSPLPHRNNVRPTAVHDATRRPA